jgi:excisionase family DNA binding protein
VTERPVPSLLTATSAAKQLDTTTAIVYELIEAGRLPARRDDRGLIRVSPDDLRRALHER